MILYFNANTVDLFTTKATGLGYDNSRALGWDTKPAATSSTRRHADINFRRIPSGIQAIQELSFGAIKKKN